MAELRKVVTDAQGVQHTVVGSSDDKSAFNDAVKAVENDGAPVYPNINHPVEKGHDLVARGGDMSAVLVDGTGAHNSPNNAVNPFSTETDPKVKVEGLEEPAYKQVPVAEGQDAPVLEADDKEVAAAKKEADSEESSESK